MNATSLYVSTSRLVFQSDGNSDQNWTDLNRLVPYLRQSLSCTVCSRLLIEPHTPVDVHCQHHVCRLCVRGRKNLKPTCSWCKDYDKYEENMQLRILLQCYKSLCEHIMTTPIYTIVRKQSQNAGLLSNGIAIPNSSLVEFIEEGAKFQDNFKSNAGLTKSAYSILPCVFPSPQQQQQLHQQQQQQQQTQQQPQQPPVASAPVVNNLCLPKQPTNNVIAVAPVETKLVPISQPPPIKTVSNGSAMYSVLYTGIGNKITIKRKTDGDEDFNARKFQTAVIRPKTVPKRRGCRCGNATATPGKLTCCGQRCPCYVESKSCIDCKCRGCRNPHRPDGGKIRPHIPELACYEIQVADESTNLPVPNLATAASSNRLEIPIDELPTGCRLSGSTQPTLIKSVPPQPPPPPPTTSSITYTTNHQVRQPIAIENVGRESLLISSPEGSYHCNSSVTINPVRNYLMSDSISVVNVFTSPHHQPHHNHTSHHHHPRTHSHQIPEISTTLPQIIMQQQDTSNMLGHANDLSGRHHSSILLSPNSTSTITLSPIIVTSSSPFPCQIFSEEEIITTQCSPTTHPPPLVDLVMSADHITSDNLQL